MPLNHQIIAMWLTVLFSAACLLPSSLWAETVDYELDIVQEKITIAGATAEGMTINGKIPGPTLRFKEGDTARIQVHNRMTVPTSIHWHGILVPPNMDGVPNISFPPIQPDSTFIYEFPIRQSGTYWYHSHSNLQEQRGVYGGMVIEPQSQAQIQRVDGDEVILFSDWTTEDPHQVLRTLKRGSEWFAIEKGSGQSIVGSARVGKLGSYLHRELQRMPAMDIADVAYDYFLANGRPEHLVSSKNKQTMRLRIINGSATTYFHLEFSGGPMTIISADGLRVQPLARQRFLIGVAETYDVLVTIPPKGAHELRATAHDGSGYASAWLGDGPRFPAPDVPKPNLYQSMNHGSLSSMFALTPAGTMGMPDHMVKSGMLDSPGMMGMDHMSMDENQPMDHGKHSMPKALKKESGKNEMHMQKHQASADADQSHGHYPKEKTSNTNDVSHKDPGVQRRGRKYAKNFRPFASDVSSMPNIATDGTDPERPWPPYDKLRAIEPTVLDPDKPVRDIRFTLDGDMERYKWFLNNKPLSESDVIRIKKGEVVRFIMINRTMMHHPMHLHGHFFRVINGQGNHAPLKHTVDVAPMSTTVIEFAANEFGDWFFHCHLLYHMKSGMARVIHYEGYQPAPEVVAVQPNLFKESWYAWGEVDVLSNMSEGALTLSNTRNMFQAAWEVGWQDVDKNDWEGVFTYDRYINRFSSLFVGADFLGEGGSSEETRGILGFQYLLPLNLDSSAWVDTDGGARVMIEKEFVLTPRFSLVGEVEYDTHDQWEGKAGVNYMISKNVSLLSQWHSEFGWGGGLQIRF